MTENPQKNHYIEVHDDYEAHYYDKNSMKYRNRFLYPHLFKGLDLNGKSVADLASGSGANSKALLDRFPQARISGYDISPAAVTAYTQTTGRPAYEVDLTVRNQQFAEQYDAAMIVGGLHHCVADLEATFSNIHAMLKPGGLLLMCEPNAQFFLEAVRKFWYKRDRYFQADTEEALSHDKILAMTNGAFEPVYLKNIGGPAYFFVLNSLIFRIPHSVKNIISPPLMLMENVYGLLPHTTFYPMFIAQWRKAETS